MIHNNKAKYELYEAVCSETISKWTIKLIVPIVGLNYDFLTYEEAREVIS